VVATGVIVGVTVIMTVIMTVMIIAIGAEGKEEKLSGEVSD
jgi:hypothetical protein